MDLSGGWLYEAENAAGSRGLPTAGFTDYAEGSTPLDVKGDVGDGRDHLFPLLGKQARPEMEFFGEVANGDDGIVPAGTSGLRGDSHVPHYIRFKEWGTEDPRCP